LKVLNFDEGAGVFLKPLGQCLSRGTPCLFENVNDELDPTLDPILEKNFVNKSGIMTIRLVEKEISYNKNFRLYFTTKLSNPKYNPEIMGNTMLINYTVTRIGLRIKYLMLSLFTSDLTRKSRERN
jgi:dynein heavy chain